MRCLLELKSKSGSSSCLGCSTEDSGAKDQAIKVISIIFGIHGVVGGAYLYENDYLLIWSATETKC